MLAARRSIKWINQGERGSGYKHFSPMDIDKRLNNAFNGDVSVESITLITLLEVIGNN